MWVWRAACSAACERGEHNLCDFNSDLQSHTQFTCRSLAALLAAETTATATTVCLSWRCHFPNLMPRDVLEIRYGTAHAVVIHIPKSQTVEGFKCLSPSTSLSPLLFAAHTYAHAHMLLIFKTAKCNYEFEIECEETHKSTKCFWIASIRRKRRTKRKMQLRTFQVVVN